GNQSSGELAPSRSLGLDTISGGYSYSYLNSWVLHQFTVVKVAKSDKPCQITLELRQIIEIY
ncbi:MAG: hypothetical protein M1288_02750, partial [Actinobacteria bacterium]|nr:hypothetical protein [Actinomycetota bacterium]